MARKPTKQGKGKKPAAPVKKARAATPVPAKARKPSKPAPDSVVYQAKPKAEPVVSTHAATVPVLSPRQIKFCHQYAKHGVAETAAVEAGYSKKSASTNAIRMLRNEGIQQYLRTLLTKACEKAGVDVARIVAEYEILAFSDLTDYVEWNGGVVSLKPSDKLDPVKRRAVVEVSQTQFGVKIKLASKQPALDSLGKHLGMFVEQVEVTDSRSLKEKLAERRAKARAIHAG